ncbi:MAG: hypothetical protein AAF497_24670 [Planctomycetota bacterium]
MSDSFEERLKQAISRGENRAAAKEEADRAKAMTEEELKNLHSRYRLKVSDHIEECVGQLPSHFPGFQLKTIYGEKGWGAACSRDDFAGGRGKGRSSEYSRLEMTVRPFSKLHVLDLSAKGTIRNKEVFNRNHFKKLIDVDESEFLRLVDVWVLEFAELYAAKV